MKLVITTIDGKLFQLDVNDDMELENLIALVSFETQINPKEITLLHNSVALNGPKRQLKELGLTDGEIILAHRTSVNSQQSTISMASANPRSQGQKPSTSNPNPFRSQQEDPAVLMEMLKNAPHEMALIKERNQPLADAILSGDVKRFTEVLNSQKAEKLRKEQERFKLLSRDPFDPQVQMQIAEEIRLKNVEWNMETAMEYAPESFGQVVMLYINCKVNGHNVKAFVDSGAQMTIMSRACAERCNIMRLIDTRWAGVAKGVGTQKIIGRVHLGEIQIGNDRLPSSFSILEQPMDMLLGLDMLKRHQCVIDMKNYELVIGTTGTKTPFLNESELPDAARLSFQPDGNSNNINEDSQLAEALARSANDNFSPGTTTRQFQESDIAKLTSLGFNRNVVIEEFTKANGNIVQATANLLAKSFSTSK